MSVGQYRSQDSVQRLYSEMTFDIYSSSSSDRSAPTIQSVSADGPQVEVQAEDESGIHRVVVAYTANDGHWYSIDLVETGNTWQGTIPAVAGTEYFVQAVDMAGNVAVDDNQGRYYSYCLMAEDVVRDGTVDIQGIMAVAEKWRVRDTDGGWDPGLDLAGDRVINVVDIMQVVKRWEAGCQ